MNKSIPDIILHGPHYAPVNVTVQQKMIHRGITRYFNLDSAILSLSPVQSLCGAFRILEDMTIFYSSIRR